MVYRVIYTTIFCLVVSHTSAQENSAEVLPKNQIDIYYHTDHFFDNTETYWLKFNPTTFGVDYTRKLKKKAERYCTTSGSPQAELRENHAELHLFQ